MIRVGLLGTGRIGSLHAETIASHPDSSLHAVSDINSDSATKLATQYGAIVKSTEDVISDQNVDAILIATSTDTHSDFIEKASFATPVPGGVGPMTVAMLLKNTITAASLGTQIGRQ